MKIYERNINNNTKDIAHCNNNMKNINCRNINDDINKISLSMQYWRQPSSSSWIINDPKIYITIDYWNFLKIQTNWKHETKMIHRRIK